MVNSDVYRSLIPLKSTLTKYCLTRRISNLLGSFEIHWVPDNFLGSSGHSKQIYLQNRVNRSQAYQIALVFNACTVDSWYIAVEYNTIRKEEIETFTTHSKKTSHTSPLQANYGASFLRSLRKIPRNIAVNFISYRSMWAIFSEMISNLSGVLKVQHLAQITSNYQNETIPAIKRDNPTCPCIKDDYQRLQCQRIKPQGRIHGAWIMLKKFPFDAVWLCLRCNFQILN